MVLHIKYKPSAVEGVCDKCGQPLTIRKDDEPQTVLDRLTTYHEQTEPLKDFYAKRGLLRAVENRPTVAEMTEAILRELEK